MASGTINGSCDNKRYILTCEWTSTPNTSANTSSITAKVYLNGNGYTTSSSYWSCVINGTTVTSNKNASIGGKTLLGTRTWTVNHNNDGTASVGISFSYSNGLSSSGTYTTKTVAKGNKYKTNLPYNDSYSLVEKNGDQMTTTVYFPSIKKGYYTTTNVSANQEQLEQMRKGTVEKTGETMEILGRKCEVYKVKYELKQDAEGTVSTTNLHNEYAICTDPSLPESDKEVLPGVKGVPLKFINNTVSQTTNEMLNFDIQVYIASLTTDIKKRAVDDSEVSVPEGIKLINGDKDQKGMLKIIEENMKYLKKNNKWVENNPDEIKIYDNLNEDWEY